MFHAINAWLARKARARHDARDQGWIVERRRLFTRVYIYDPRLGRHVQAHSDHGRAIAINPAQGRRS